MLGKNIFNMGQKDLLDNIEKALAEIRPYLLTDGGDISFVSLDEVSRGLYWLYSESNDFDKWGRGHH